MRTGARGGITIGERRGARRCWCLASIGRGGVRVGLTHRHVNRLPVLQAKVIRLTFPRQVCRERRQQGALFIVAKKPAQIGDEGAPCLVQDPQPAGSTRHAGLQVKTSKSSKYTPGASQTRRVKGDAR